MDPVGSESRDDAITSGSDTRPSRDLAEPLVLDLATEAGTLFGEPSWGDRDRNSRTISTSRQMRITLTALRSGAELGNEGTNDTLAVQMLRGSATLDVDGRQTQLHEGQLASVAQPGTWRLAATSDALLLLTVALGRPGPGS